MLIPGVTKRTAKFARRLELEAHGEVEGVALERILGVELLIPLGENGKRLGRIVAGGEAHDRADAVNARFE